MAVAAVESHRPLLRHLKTLLHFHLRLGTVKMEKKTAAAAVGSTAAAAAGGCLTAAKMATAIRHRRCMLGLQEMASKKEAALKPDENGKIRFLLKADFRWLLSRFLLAFMREKNGSLILATKLLQFDCK